MCVCACMHIFLDKGREIERKSTLPPHLSTPPTHPSSLLPRHPFHYNDNRIWRAALLLLSEPGLVISLSAPLLPTCMLVSWFILHSPWPPLKTKGSRLLQGCYSPVAIWTAEFYSWQTDHTKNLICRGPLFNDCSAVAPGICSDGGYVYGYS